MTATIDKPGSEDPRHRTRRRHEARFSSMESLGFIETPTTVSNTWWADSSPPAPVSTVPLRRGVHERTVADWQPLDTTGEFVRRRLRWGTITVVALLVAGLAASGLWLWERPAAIAEAAAGDVTAAAEALQPELLALRGLNETLTDGDIDITAIATRTLAVEAPARDLFDAASELPSEAVSRRAQAVDAATRALEASRVIGDAVAYRSAVIQILAPPDLETDPSLIALDDAIRDFGEWQQRFDDVRSALPSDTMPAVSEQLELIAANLEPIRSRYFDGLGDDDRVSAEQALDDLAAQLAQAETMLFASLEEVQARVGELIESSLGGIESLLG